MGTQHETTKPPRRLKLGLMLATSLLAGFLTVVVMTQLRSGQAEAAIETALAEGDESLLPDYCSSTSLTAGPSSYQLSCLSDVKADYGTLDCSAPKGFETRLKADVEKCQLRVMACLSDKPAAQLDAVARPSTAQKSTRIVKREPAKLVQLGRAQPAAQTRSYLIQCDTEGRNLH